MTWWCSVRDNPPDVESLEWTWYDFRERIKKVFQPIDPETQARDKLCSLVQTSTVSAYASIFRQTVSKIHDMSEADKVHKFTFGLKYAIKQQVRVARAKTLDDAMEIAFRAEGLEYSPPPDMSTRASSSSFVDPDGPVPMELGTMHKSKFNNNHQRQGNGNQRNNGGNQRNQGYQRSGNQRNQGNQSRRGTKISFKEQVELYAQGKCFDCKQPGHIAANCPNKTKN